MTDFAAIISLSTLDGTDGFRLDGVAADDLSGVWVSSAGDINGDGLDDILIGASGAVVCLHSLTKLRPVEPGHHHV